VCCGLGESSGKQPDNDDDDDGVGADILAVAFYEVSTVQCRLAEYLPPKHCPLFQSSSSSDCY
jgi:hypothetical protein